MREEEKKAIKELTEIKELVEEDLRYKDYEATAILDQIDLESLIIVLNLIEKQQKEIEELKNGQIDFWISDKEIEERIRNKFVSKDKIKAKIEEYKKQIEKMEKDDIERGFTLGKEWSDLKAKVEFGQSLLKEE